MKLCQAEAMLHEDKTTSEVYRTIGISDATYYKWHKEYGDLQVSQVKRLKELKRENKHLQKAVANLTIDKIILQDVV